MEIKSSDGSNTQLKPYSTIVLGRGNGFYPNDLAVSRRHLSLEFNPTTESLGSQTAPRVPFEVLGKNPVWIYTKNEDGKIRVFKRFQRGELGVGDMFCLSAKDPVWFTVNEVEEQAMEEREMERGQIDGRVYDELSQGSENSYGVNSNGDFELDAVDVSSIDPVEEFGFLVIGHEFDQYPKQMIRDVKNWEWFLDDPRGGDSDEDEEVAERRGRKGGRGGKRKKTKGDDEADDDWTGESEDEKVITTKARKVQRPSYQTRSKDQGKPRKSRNNKKSTANTGAKEEEEDEYEEDEEDETLGGFIVGDETVEEDEDEEEYEEEDEEEFIEDEDELED